MPEEQGKDPAAVALGKRGGEGARAETMSPAGSAKAFVALYDFRKADGEPGICGLSAAPGSPYQSQGRACAAWSRGPQIRWATPPSPSRDDQLQQGEAATTLTTTLNSQGGEEGLSCQS
jgi:hypothetical protein